MSVFFISPQAGQTRFSTAHERLTTNGQKALRTAESLAEQLNTGAQALSDEQQKAAQDLIDDFKTAVETSSSVIRSMKNNKDALRQQRIARIEARIEQLKELLRFATPEQAKRLLKELKQIGKEFSGVAKGLNKAATDVGGISAAGLTAATDTVTSVLDATFGSVARKSAAAQAPANIAPPPVLAAIDNQAANGGHDGFQATDHVRASSNYRQQTEALKAGVHAYADQQAKADKAFNDTRLAGMQGEQEKLRKIGNDIKWLAAQLEALANKDDDEARKDLKALREELRGGRDALNDPALQAALGSGLQALETPPAQSGTASATAVPVSGSGVNLSHTGSVPVTNILA